MSDKTTRGAAIVALLAAFAALTISLTVDTTDDGQGHKRRTITFHVDRSGAPGVQTTTVTVPQSAVANAETTLEADLKNEAPSAAQIAVPGELKAAQDAAGQIAATQPPLPTAGASAGFKGCTTRFVVNQSSRHGVRPQLQVLHYTVSPNVSGWADVNAVVALFNRSASQASSNFVIDGEGHCAYIVPIEAKAWTQAAGNPFSISYEVINSGREGVFMAPAGLKRLRDVMRQVSARTGIPLRAGAVSGCVPVVSGIVQHKDFGLCGGGHVDITPFSSAAVIKVLAARQPVAKKVVWIRHRKAVHLQYVARCPRHSGGTPECQALRVRARKLDQLIARR